MSESSKQTNNKSPSQQTNSSSNQKQPTNNSPSNEAKSEKARDSDQANQESDNEESHSSYPSGQQNSETLIPPSLQSLIHNANINDVIQHHFSPLLEGLNLNSGSVNLNALQHQLAIAAAQMVASAQQKTISNINQAQRQFNPASLLAAQLNAYPNGDSNESSKNPINQNSSSSSSSSPPPNPLWHNGQSQPQWQKPLSSNQSPQSAAAAAWANALSSASNNQNNFLINQIQSSSQLNSAFQQIQRSNNTNNASRSSQAPSKTKLTNSSSNNMNSNAPNGGTMQQALNSVYSSAHQNIKHSSNNLSKQRNFNNLLSSTSNNSAASNSSGSQMRANSGFGFIDQNSSASRSQFDVQPLGDEQIQV